MKLAQRVARIQPSATLAINAKARRLKKQGVHIVNFGVGEPDFDTPLHIQEAAINAIKDGQTRYTPVSGIDELKDAICYVIRNDYGLSYARENVLVSCGGKHAIYNLLQALLDPGDEVIIPSPYWVSYPEMVSLIGGKPVTVPCAEEYGFKLHPDALESAITPRTRLLIINSPSNPTGVHYSRSELAGLAEVLLKHEDVAVITDDIYYRILFDGHEWCNLAMVSEALRDRTFIINGVSKTYCMTGWRIGYVVGNADVIRAATKIQSQSTSNPTSISQWASVAAMRGDQSVVQEMVKVFEQRCRYVLECLSKLPGVTCPTPAGAFYVFPNFSHYYEKKVGDRSIKNSLDLADYLMEIAHVAVVPGSAFGEDHCLRLSYALSMEDLQEGFARVARALENLS
ncbi:pyridoxal phosphate-dependent aminotransferase [Desulforhabdus amnigena]|jgi:aspartate aminotransferase|uniref:Aminotransferase n=1 Tax=Desulforhabdus amnigena TaxID=40218 RepID=A0A9W6FTI6_9BACT|nr:pyridoxal phosphate-dependent aminotransferase [Desulforhabdus amnigena]NLJ28226.1 pyridoxal phosphate-dependent aminotransferase [Deltaproteobacteria bacterium]GLI33995.1 aminotransferase [Desulforhabdus amnigena]